MEFSLLYHSLDGVGKKIRWQQIMTNKRVVEMVERSIKWAARGEKEHGTG